MVTLVGGGNTCGGQVALQPTLKDDPPGCEEGLEERHTGELPVLSEADVQAGQHGLDGQVGEAVGSGGKDVGDAGIHVGVVAGVAAQVAAHGVVAHNVLQVVPEHKHLRWRVGGRRRKREGRGHHTGSGAPPGCHLENLT